MSKITLADCIVFSLNICMLLNFMTIIRLWLLWCILLVGISRQGDNCMLQKSVVNCSGCLNLSLRRRKLFWVLTYLWSWVWWTSWLHRAWKWVVVEKTVHLRNLCKRKKKHLISSGEKLYDLKQCRLLFTSNSSDRVHLKRKKYIETIEAEFSTQLLLQTERCLKKMTARKQREDLLFYVS